MDGLTGEWGEATLSSRSPDRQFVSYNSFFFGLAAVGGIEEMIFMWILYAHTAERRSVFSWKA